MTSDVVERVTILSIALIVQVPDFPLEALDTNIQPH